ncbi:MAG: V-type ATP synthase subunit C [Bacillota bacterium]|nr:V-type ATP synthase subunit C [Bacillota bacterium]
MPVVDDTIYAYAVGRIRALEAKLIERNRFDRMIDASSASEALKMLAESDYSNAVSELSDVHEFELILTVELKNTFELIRKISPKPELITIMAVRNDIHNLKVLLKAKYLGIKSDLMVPTGSIDLGVVQYAVAEDDYRDLPVKLREAAEKINEDFLVNRNPQAIDLTLDKVLFDQLIFLAGESKSEFLKGLFVRQIDLINLKTLVRIKRMGLDREFFKQVIINHGSLGADRLSGLIDEPLESLITTLSMTDYADLVSDGIRDWLDRGTASRYEKLADDFITSYLKKGKWMPFGPEPLIGYLWAKEIEIKNIRLIMVGKINKLPAEAIRERVRDVYL